MRKDSPETNICGQPCPWQCQKYCHSRNTSTHYNRSPKEPIFECFLILMTTSRHRGLFFSSTKYSQILNNFYVFELLNNRTTTFLFLPCRTFQLLYTWFCLQEVKGCGVWLYSRQAWVKKSSVASAGLTHLICIHWQLEVACRKLDLITQYFHSSHLFRRESCSFASSTIKITQQDQFCLLVRQIPVNF